MENFTGQLYYFGDPMCSWCYGIAEHLDQLIINFKGQLEFELILGGLRPGGGEEWTASFKDFLREHWDHAQKASGQPFNYKLLDWKEFDYDTEPACRAVRIARDLAPEQEFTFFKACQYRFYFENENPLHVDFYLPICKKLNIPEEKFTERFQSSTYKELVKEDFLRAQQLGISGFPAIVLQYQQEYYMITNGYNTFEKMKTRVESILKN